MGPAFHRVHEAQRHIARRVIIRLLFDPFTVKWACAFVGSEDVPARGRSRVASQRCSQTRTRSRSSLRYLTAKMAAQDGPAPLLLGSYGCASSVIVRHRRSTILRYDSRAENACATSPRRATPR